MKMMYTPRHCARYFRRLRRREMRRQRWAEAIQQAGAVALGGSMIGLLLGLMFVI